MLTTDTVDKKKNEFNAVIDLIEYVSKIKDKTKRNELCMVQECGSQISIMNYYF